MLDSQKLAVAAHLHVLLRRKTGRVTDTEWMVANPDYAREVARFARMKAREDGHQDLAEWAAKLEQAVLGRLPTNAPAIPVPGAAGLGPAPRPAQTALERLRERARLEASYIGGLR